MTLPERYGKVEYDEEGNIIMYEGIPIQQYQIPLLYRSLPPHKRKVVQSIFYCYALDEMDDLLQSEELPIVAFNEMANMVVEKAARSSREHSTPNQTTEPPPKPAPATPEEMPKKRRPKKS